jgi:hypothetical protein
MTSPENDRTGHRATDAELEQRARRLFHGAAQHLDTQTAARLRSIRRQTLATPLDARHATARWLVPTGAFAVIALASLMIWRPSSHPAVPTSVQASAEAASDIDSDLPPDADRTDPNLYQNLDFYGWLAANDSQSTAH